MDEKFCQKMFRNKEAIVQVDVLAGYEQGVEVFHYGKISRIHIGDQCAAYQGYQHV
jgi:hypothetical protein